MFLDSTMHILTTYLLMIDKHVIQKIMPTQPVYILNVYKKVSALLVNRSIFKRVILTSPILKEKKNHYCNNHKKRKSWFAEIETKNCLHLYLNS